VRNKRDSRFYRGNKPAGSMGITKQTLHFLQTYLNPLAFMIQGKMPKEEEGGELMHMKFEPDMFDLYGQPLDFP
jgi:hypothetical protein